MVEFLMNNIEAFAWIPYEMSGVDPDFICHKLNVSPLAILVIQKATRSALVHMDAIIEEVDKLLEASSIREVQYP